MVGEKELCTNKSCVNSSFQTVNKETLNRLQENVGYNSRIKNWNSSRSKFIRTEKILKNNMLEKRELTCPGCNNPGGKTEIKYCSLQSTTAMGAALSKAMLKIN